MRRCLGIAPLTKSELEADIQAARRQRRTVPMRVVADTNRRGSIPWSPPYGITQGQAAQAPALLRGRRRLTGRVL